MTADQFAYWLQGFAELNSGPPSDEQWQSIRDHLATVFVKVTPGLAGIPRWQQPTSLQPLRSECASDGCGTVLIC